MSMTIVAGRPALPTAGCPHGATLGTCPELWCRSRTEDLDRSYLDLVGRWFEAKPLMAPETLAEAQRAEGQPEPETEEPPTLEELVRHCGMAGESGCSDGWIATDFDAVLSVARPEDQLAPRRYRKLRMAHPGYKRREYDPEKANSHRKVIAAWREAVRKQTATTVAVQPTPNRMDPASVAPWCTCDGCKFGRSHATPAPIRPVSTQPTERECLVCGKSLEGRRADVKACSKWCRRALARWNKADEAEQREA
jgi:hypothetical protein